MPKVFISEDEFWPCYDIQGGGGWGTVEVELDNHTIAECVIVFRKFRELQEKLSKAYREGSKWKPSSDA